MVNIISVFLLSCLIFAATSTTKLIAQEGTNSFSAKNAVYLEIGGNGGYYSVNYDRIIYDNGNNFKAAVRAGIEGLPFKRDTKSFWAGFLPLELSGMFGRSRHFLETGVGLTPFLIPKNDWGKEPAYSGYKPGAIIPFRLGYRYQKPEGGLFFRAGYTPFLDFSEGRRNPLELFFGGISIGKSY